jgi:adenine nucleotide transporter 17
VQEEVFSYRSLVHAISGMIGGATAITAFYPLNVVRTRLQVTESKEMESMVGLALRMLREEGLPSLFTGWQSQVMALAASNFVYFYQYNGLRAMVQKMAVRQGRSRELSAGTNLLIATVAGVINVLATTPLWVVSTRLSVQRGGGGGGYRGMWDGLTRIAREEGIAALWNGTVPSLLLVSNPSIQFVCYERIKLWLGERARLRGTPITPIEFFLMGAAAKTVATILTYPIQLAQSRLRAMKAKGQQQQHQQQQVKYQYTGTVDVLLKVVQNDGPLGLFRGMEAKLYQTVATAALMFATYEQIQALVFAALLRNQQKK